MRTVTVICPVYNEEEVILEFYKALHAVLISIAESYEANILFVVDRCTDATLGILKEIAARDRSVKVLALASRFGHQMSLLAGIDYCSADAVIMMDSDLQHPPMLIPEMLAAFEKGYDIVYTIRQDSPEIGFFKRNCSKWFYRFINRISKVPINESAADFRLISRRVAEVFQKQIREQNQFIRGLVSWVGFDATGIPYRVGERRAGKSKYSLRRMIRFGLNGIISFSKRPLQAAILLGFAFAALGLLFIAVTFVQYFMYQSFPSGWATVVILIALFSGVQLIFLGILGEYIGAIFDEVKRRPHYIVHEKVNFDD